MMHMKIKCPKCKVTYEAMPYELRNDELCAHCVSELPIYQCPLCSKEVIRTTTKSLYGHQVCRPCRFNFATRRQVAFLIDWFSFYLLFLILWNSLNGVIQFSGVVVLALFIIKDSFKGHSLGKRILGLQVINDKDGEPIGLSRSIMRNIQTMLPIPLYRLFLGIQLYGGYRNGDGWAQTKVIWKKLSLHPIFQPKCSAEFVWTEENMQLEGEKILSSALKKEIKGDWDEALRLYRQIITDFPETQIANDATVSLKSLRERIKSNCEEN